jgi:hypothetical protein
MASKSILIGTLAALVAAGAVVTYLLLESPDKGDGDPVKPQPTEKAPPKPKTDDRPVAVADEPRAPVRNEVAPIGPNAQFKGGVEGTITSASNEPVVGAKVELIKALEGGSPLGMSIMQLQKMRSGDTSKPESYSAVSGADGKYRIVAPPSDGWRIVASHPDYARSETSNITTPAEGFFTFPIVMRSGVRMYGRVTEHEKNMPIIGATVVLDDQPPLGGFNTSTNDRRETATDTSGAYKFENVNSGRHSITIKAITYGTKFNPVVTIPDEQTFRYDAVMNPGASISGHVLDAQGNFIAKARVKAVATTGGLGGSFGEAVTNENGEFVIKDVDEGRYFLSADAGALGVGRPDPTQPSVQSGATNVEIRLAPQCGVQGAVRDKLNNQPIATFRVEVRRGGQGQKVFPRELGPIAFKDRRDGSFEINGLAGGGQYVLYVSADGYAPSYSEPFTVQPAQVTRGINVAISVGGTIRGQVVDLKNAQPVAGATVRTRDNEYKDISSVPFFGSFIASQPQRVTDVTVTTDANGKFEIKNVEEGIVKLQVSHPRYVTTYQGDVGVFDGKTSETGPIHLFSGATVKGTVFGPDGAPAANAEVTIKSGGQLHKDRLLFTKAVRCDAQGRYSISNVPAGEYNIHAVPVKAGGAPPDPFSGMVQASKSRKPIILSEAQEQEMDLYISN